MLRGYTKERERESEESESEKAKRKERKERKRTESRSKKRKTEHTHRLGVAFSTSTAIVRAEVRPRCSARKATESAVARACAAAAGAVPAAFKRVVFRGAALHVARLPHPRRVAVARAAVAQPMAATKEKGRGVAGGDKRKVKGGKKAGAIGVGAIIATQKIRLLPRKSNTPALFTDTYAHRCVVTANPVERACGGCTVTPSRARWVSAIRIERPICKALAHTLRA